MEVLSLVPHSATVMYIKQVTVDAKKIVDVVQNYIITLEFINDNDCFNVALFCKLLNKLSGARCFLWRPLMP